MQASAADSGPETPPKGHGSTPTTANRACQNCAKAKAKCTPHEDSSIDRCARCHRLRKECHTLPRSVRKKRSPNTSSTTTAQLEEKIENLVNLLAAAQGKAVQPDVLPRVQTDDQVKSAHSIPLRNTTLTSWSPGAPIKAGGLWNTAPQNQIPPGVSSAAEETPLQRACSTSFQSTPRPVPYPSPTDSTLTHISTQDEDDLLRSFQEQFAVRFPFVIIPPRISASQLRIDKPYLFRVVIMVASQSKRMMQIEMAKQFCMDIAASLLIKGERSLDMLQAMLIYNAWSYYYSPLTPQTQSSAMFQLQFAMLFDLGLSRPVREVEGPEAIVDPSKHSTEINPKETKRTLEERRALLASYIITSAASLYIKKADGLSFSAYMDYNCKILEETAEYESDLLLVALVRLQFVGEQFHKNVLSKTKDSEDLKAPAWMYIKTMRHELQSLWATFSPALRQNPTLIMTYHSIEVFLFEPCMQVSQSSIGFSIGPTYRIEMLHACLQSARSLLDLFLALPLSAYFAVPMTELSNIGQGFATLFKLSLLEFPGWDLSYVRKIVSDTDYFDRLISNFEQVGAIIDQSQPEPCRNSFPTGCSGAMRKVKTLYDAKVAASTTQDTSQEQTNPPLLDPGLNFDQMDWMDDVYWQQLLNDGQIFQ